ncbi:MAG: 30S ribosomal protein S2 [Patescibacteria group bacterium]
MQMVQQDEEKLAGDSANGAEKSNVDPALLEEMVKAGVLYGRRKSKTNPHMQRYIFTTRNGAEILDIVQTVPMIERAAQFIADVVRKHETILIVGTTPASREYVKALAEKFGYPYVTERWLGGTLTNFKTIFQRLQYYLKLKADRQAGRLEKYTKKERGQFDKEIERLEFLFKGLETITKLPYAILVVGVSSHEIVVREARRLKIPIVGILSSDADPDLVNYPVPANDFSKPSVQWVMKRFESAIEEARKQPIVPETTPEVKQ